MNKNIKTLVGVALTTLMAFAGSSVGVEAATLQPGDTSYLGPQKATYIDFANNNVKPTKTGTAVAEQTNPGTLGSWWRFIDSSTDIGVGTATIRYPLDLSKDFSMEVGNSTGGTENDKWSTDFIGMILSTSGPEELAAHTYTSPAKRYEGSKEVDVPYTDTSGPAGYADPTVDWQLAFGTNVYGIADQFLSSTRTPYNVIRLTQKGSAKALDGNNWQAYNNAGKNFFDTTLELSYSAATREITLKAEDAHQGLLNNRGTRTEKTTVPADVSKLYLAIAGAINGNKQKNSSTVGLKQMNGYYQMTDSPVDFKKVTGETMGAQSTVHSPIGLKFSIAGAAPYNLTEPAMPGYAVTADAAPRTGTAGEISQPLQVLYEGATQQLPVEIRDRDNGDQLVTTKSTPVKTDATYNLTEQDLSSLVPENYVYASAEHLTGTLTVDASGKVTNDPVIVYVKHKTEVQTHTYTRTINYVTPDTITAPDPVVQTLEQRREVDMVTKAETILDKGLSFPAVETPNLTGYVPDVYTVPEKAIDNAQENYTVTVTYSGTVGLSVPTSVDFGNVPVESGVFRGQATQPAQVVNGQLAVIDTKSVSDRTWHLEAQVTQAPTDHLTSSTLTNVSYLINDQQVSATTPTTIFNGSQMTGTEHELFSSSNPNFLQLRFPKDLNFQNYHIDSPYNSQIKWTLANVPV